MQKGLPYVSHVDSPFPYNKTFNKHINIHAPITISVITTANIILSFALLSLSFTYCFLTHKRVKYTIYFHKAYIDDYLEKRER